MKNFLSAIALMLGLGLATASIAQQDISQPPINYCVGGNIQLCGENYLIGNTALGAVQNITLPNRFVISNVTLQCVYGNGGYNLKPTDSAALNCARKICKAGFAQICGTQIPIQGESYAGDMIDLPQSSAFFATNILPTALRAQCDATGTGTGTQYDIVDADSVSCNIFACMPTQLTACGETVQMTGPANLGAMIQAQTDSQHPVMVQCIGSQAQAPQYKIIDQLCN